MRSKKNAAEEEQSYGPGRLGNDSETVSIEGNEGTKYLAGKFNGQDMADRVVKEKRNKTPKHNMTTRENLKACIRPDIVNFLRVNMAKRKQHKDVVKMKSSHQTSAQSWGTERVVSRIFKDSNPRPLWQTFVEGSRNDDVVNVMLGYVKRLQITDEDEFFDYHAGLCETSPDY
ncbi:hypothetical protein SUGI_0014370 [Cryptomeria japonica]|nr:hypothetical protein SUGI_0014370 [Cryptomeria japonica]